MTELKLWKFSEDYGRMGVVEGLFIATEEEVDRFLRDKKINFGEILGKHSEVSVCFDNEHLKCLDVSESTINELFQKINSRCIVGQDPFDQVYDSLKCTNCGHEGMFTSSWWNPKKLTSSISCPECDSEKYTMEE